MIKTWILRKLFGAAPGCAQQRGNSQEESCLAGMIESGDFRIDLAMRTVTLRGQELYLTAQEFDVLVFLAGHPRRLVTPRTKLATNWTPNGVRQTEFLKTLVLLRKKLDAAGQGKRYLRTEPWVIYRFDTTASPV